MRKPLIVLAIVCSFAVQLVFANQPIRELRGSSSGSSSPAQVQLQPGDIVVASGSDGIQGVYRIDPTNGAQTVITAGGVLGDPVAVEVEADGSLVVVDGDRFGSFGGSPQVIRVDPSNGNQTLVSSFGFMLDPNDITIADDGTLLVADFSGPTGVGGIIGIDPVTGDQHIVSLEGPPPFNLDLEASGDIVFSNFNAFASPVYRVSKETGTATELTPDAGAAFGIAVGPGGDIYVADYGAFGANAFVQRVDPVAGDVTAITDDGDLGTFIIGIDTNALGEILVSQPTTVMRVNPTTGEVQVVSTGGVLDDLKGLAVVPGPVDSDGDGIVDDQDVCADTVIPESVPTSHLGVNRWALVDDDGAFDKTPPPGGGGGPKFEFTLMDTAGCSCEQIIEAMALGWGQTTFGCSTGAMLQWIAQPWLPSLPD